MQLFLKANVGVDYVDLFNLVHVIASWRLHELPQQLTSSREPHLADVTSASADDVKLHLDFTDNHLVYDLFRLDKILAEMTQPAVLEVLDLAAERLLSSPTILHAQVHKSVSKACEYLGFCI